MAKASGSTKRRTSVDERELDQVVRGEHSDPHRILGVHGTTVRGFRPGAKEMFILVPDGDRVPMDEVHPGGVFEGDLLLRSCGVLHARGRARLRSDVHEGHH